MFCGRYVWKCLGVGAALFSLYSFALAQAPIRLDSTEQTQALEGPGFTAPAAEGEFYFGVMGQIARPGVYEIGDPHPQLIDLLRHAGGLTQQATNEIHIVREGRVIQPVYFSTRLDFLLWPGDIIVADGPLLADSELKLESEGIVQNANFAESADKTVGKSYRQVALIGVLDRPVILPVLVSSANRQDIVAYLGQAASVANEVHILPVGEERRNSAGETASELAFLVPTVLFFDPASVEAERLPQFPDVYRIGGENAESKVAQPLSPTPNPELSFPAEDQSPPMRFQRPVHTGVESSSTSAEPASFSQTHVLQNPSRPPTPHEQFETAPSPEPETAPSPTDETEQSSSTWPYWGIIFAGLFSGGIYARRRFRRRLPYRLVPGISPLPPQTPPQPEIPSQKETPPEPVSESGAFVLDDELAALVYNQLPVLEESAERLAATRDEKTLKPQKTFRLDPAANSPSAGAVGPNFLRRSHPTTGAAPDSAGTSSVVSDLDSVTVSLPVAKPILDETPSSTDSAESGPTLGVLDRVLLRVHQSRAA